MKNYAAMLKSVKNSICDSHEYYYQMNSINRVPEVKNIEFAQYFTCCLLRCMMMHNYQGYEKAEPFFKVSVRDVILTKDTFILSTQRLMLSDMLRFKKDLDDNFLLFILNYCKESVPNGNNLGYYNTMWGRQIKYVILAIAKRKNPSDAIINWFLYVNKNTELAKHLVLYKWAKRNVFEAFLQHSSWKIRRFALQSKYVPRDLFEKCITDTHPKIQEVYVKKMLLIK